MYATQAVEGAFAHETDPKPTLKLVLRGKTSRFNKYNNFSHDPHTLSVNSE